MTLLARLEHAAKTLRASGNVDDGLVARSITDIIAGVDPAEALDLECLDDHRRAERDRLIRAVVARHGLTYAALTGLITRYAATAWLRERVSLECPAVRLNRPEEYAWRILRLGLGAPAQRTIERAMSRHDTPFSGGPV